MRSLLVVALVGLALMAEAERPSPPASNAHLLYQRGQTEFEAAHFVEAAKLFEEAYAASHKTALLWNAAQAWRKQYDLDGDLAGLRRAGALYRNYGEMVEAPAEKTEAAKEEEAVNGMIRDAEARAAAARIVVTAPPPTAPAPMESAPPVYKKWWFWTALAGAVIVIAGVSFALGAGTSVPSTRGGDWVVTF